MKLSVLALFAIICAGIFVGVMWHDSQQLPPQIASHFNLAGKADCEVPRSTFLPSALALGLGTPAFIVLVMYVLRYLPVSSINVPHPEYWRTPENHPRAYAILFRFSL